MRFFGAGRFLREVRDHHTLNIQGRRGSGKTLLSFAVAREFLRAGWASTIHSNVESSLCSPLYCPLESAFIVLDESWILLDSREWRKNKTTALGAFLRKRAIWLALPSVFPIDSRYRALRAWRRFNLYRAGLPIWYYRWESGSGRDLREGGFWLFMPSSFFGQFDSFAEICNDAGILDCLSQSFGLHSQVIGAVPWVPDGDGDGE